MKSQIKFDLGAYVRERFPNMIALRRPTDAGRYEAAVEAFAEDGNRAQFMRDLLAIGVSADQVRWHMAHRGERMMTISAADESYR